MFKKTIVVITLLLVLFPSQAIYAAQGLSSTIGFNQTVNLLLYGNFGKITNKSGTNGYPTINSKWNQPRKVDGSNPHRGTDFNLKQGDEFILPFGGFVVESSTASGKNATFVVMLDVNGNQKNDDNVWLRVWHTKKKDNIAKNTYYAKETAVGVVQDYNGDGSSNTKGDHLHFGVVFDSGTYEQYGPMYPYYLNVAYNDGKHLDLISYVNPTTSGLSFTAYIMDETKTDPQAPNDIVIFHKKSTETKWKRYNVPVNSTHNYYVTWSSLGYSIGQFTNIQYIIRVGRYSNVSDSGTQWTYYNWGFYPAKYERPDPDPDVSNDSPQPAYETYILL